MDDLSEGEGDEEEGERQRLEDEARQDRLKTKKILEALASGHKGSQRREDLTSRGHYGLDELLVGDILEGNKKQGEDEPPEDGLNFDDDEELQAKYLNQMKSRISGQKEETAVDELTDEDESDDESNEEGKGRTAEEKEDRARLAAIEKENYRRYFEQALRNRALRMNLTKEKDEQNPLPPLTRLPSSTPLSRSSSDPDSGHDSFPIPQIVRVPTSVTPSQNSLPGHDLKRRVSMPPRKVDVSNFPRNGQRESKMRRVQSANGSVTNGAKTLSSRTNDFVGVLNKDELEAGHGMFMGVSLSKRKQVGICGFLVLT